MNCIKDFFNYCISAAESKEKENKVKDTLQEKETSKRKMRKRINSLENQVETLESTIKDELYTIFMAKLGEPEENKRLKKENKKLRLQNKQLKEIIKEGR